MDFYDLEVWKRAKDIVIVVYKLTKHFPKEEIYGLTNQLRRASCSICANIAEGFSRYHTRDKIKFYYNARGSITESMNHILIVKDLSFLSSKDARDLLKGFETIRKMLNGIIRSISNSPYCRKK